MEEDHMPFDVFSLTRQVGIVTGAVLVVDGGGLA